jgi:hypothetical protein
VTKLVSEYSCSVGSRCSSAAQGYSLDASGCSLHCIWLQVLLRCLCQPLYFSVEFFGACRGPGFFFVLDLIATATMAWDVMPAFEDATEKFAQAARLKTQTNDLAGVTQSLETGTRVGRILRLIRVVRVVKVISLLGKRNKDKASEELQPSAVGKRLNELIIQKVPPPLPPPLLPSPPPFSTPTPDHKRSSSPSAS